MDEVIAQLKAHEQNVVSLACRDGRTVLARIVHVDEEYCDVLYNAIAGAEPVWSPVSILPLADITAVRTVQD